jgi:hypothetical protein
MRQKGSFSQEAYASQARDVKTRGRGIATFEGEERVRQGKGLDSLVDASQRGVIREANNLLLPKGDQFVLEFGIAMPVKTDFDTTASMGKNVDIAFDVQPRVQKLLNDPKKGVLRRYHTQMATGSIGDTVNRFPYQVSQFEPDNEVARQMGLLVPERNGGSTTTEEYQLSLFSTAYLTRSSVTKYGLRGYYFPTGDERGWDVLKEELATRVFGPTVFEKAFGKGNRPQSLPKAQDMGKKVLENWHGFFLQVYSTAYTTKWWSDVLGRERVIILPRTQDLAEVQAVVIGLTEGVLDLQSAIDLLKESNVQESDAKRIVEACSNIPIGLQKTFANFEKIPMAGAIFASRDDIWPEGEKGTAKKGRGKRPPKDGGDKKSWKV